MSESILKKQHHSRCFKRYAGANPVDSFDPSGCESVGEFLKRRGGEAAYDGNYLETYGWGVAIEYWKYFGTESVSRLMDAAVAGRNDITVRDYALATIEVAPLAGKLSSLFKGVMGIDSYVVQDISPGRIVIGEDMDRVTKAARLLKAETFTGWGKEENRAWTQMKRAQGYEVYDIGPSFGRRVKRVEQGLRPDSSYYNIERQEMRDYDRYYKLFERTGKLSGGVMGLDY